MYPGRPLVVKFISEVLGRRKLDIFQERDSVVCLNVMSKGEEEG